MRAIVTLGLVLGASTALLGCASRVDLSTNPTGTNFNQSSNDVLQVVQQWVAGRLQFVTCEHDCPQRTPKILDLPDASSGSPVGNPGAPGIASNAGVGDSGQAAPSVQLTTATQESVITSTANQGQGSKATVAQRPVGEGARFDPQIYQHAMQQINGSAPAQESKTISKPALVRVIRIFFKFDDADLTPNAASVLKQSLPELRQAAQIGLVAHSDTLGGVALNESLKSRRRASVQAWLLAQGLDAVVKEPLGESLGGAEVTGMRARATHAQQMRRVDILVFK